MASVQQWNKTIASLGKWYGQEKAKNKALQDKINALENAKRILRDALNAAESMNKHAKKVKIGDRWKGKLAKQARSAKKTGVSTSSNICGDIKAGISDLQHHVNKLRAQQNDLVKLMSKIEGRIENARIERARERAKQS